MYFLYAVEILTKCLEHPNLVLKSVSGSLHACVSFTHFSGGFSSVFSLWDMFLCLICLLPCVCFYVLGRATMSPGLGGGCSVGPVVQALQSPELGAPSACPVWVLALCTVLL